MWTYEKRLEYPVNIKNPNPAMAKFIISQVGGPDGELAASQRYLSQRYSMPYNEAKATLTDVGTEELAHLEMVSAIIHQLTKGMTMEQIKAAGFETYFVDHTAGVYPQAAAGFPFDALSLRWAKRAFGFIVSHPSGISPIHSMPLSFIFRAMVSPPYGTALPARRRYPVPVR